MEYDFPLISISFRTVSSEQFVHVTNTKNSISASVEDVDDTTQNLTVTISQVMKIMMCLLWKVFQYSLRLRKPVCPTEHPCNSYKSHVIAGR